ncbi:MAG: zinc transporter ZupT [Candidatus Rifleibacteriota bacterium]
MHENFYIAFGLTLLAGLSTGIGSALALFAKRTNTKFLSLALGFSAGVMLYVSFIEIFSKAKTALTKVYGSHDGYIYTTIAFFVGMIAIGLIDKLVPDIENPHEMHEIEEMNLQQNEQNRKLMRMGLFTALAIGIHNFPEGLATFLSGLSDPSIGLSIAVAIAIHNIPEGISVSIPVYYATGSRKKAFWYSFLSGVSEPLGALIGYAILYKYIDQTVFGLIFASVAGIMVFISLDELLPSAEKYGEHHLSIYGMVTGMIVMAASLLLFA